jgi:hypothetical protein
MYTKLGTSFRIRTDSGPHFELHPNLKNDLVANGAEVAIRTIGRSR